MKSTVAFGALGDDLCNHEAVRGVANHVLDQRVTAVAIARLGDRRFAFPGTTRGRPGAEAEIPARKGVSHRRAKAQCWRPSGGEGHLVAAGGGSGRRDRDLHRGRPAGRGGGVESTLCSCPWLV